MGEGSPESRIETFQEKWFQLAQNPASTPHYRLDLEYLLTNYLNEIKKASDIDELINKAEEFEADLSGLFTPRLESASTLSFQGLDDKVSNAIRADRENLSEKPDLKRIIVDTIEEESLRNRIEETDYEYDHVKSDLFREITSISAKRSVRTTQIYGLMETIFEHKTELESEEFTSRYRSALVDLIEAYLNGEDIDCSLQVAIGELVGELDTVGWGEDSLKEITQVLDSSDDIGEFSCVLRGEKYQWEYCVALPDDEIPQPHMEVGGVNFYMEECDDFTYLTDLVASDERGYPFIEPMIDETDFYAVFKIIAPTKEIGERKMEKRLERAIDALNYSKDMCVVQSPFIQNQTKFVCKNPNGNYSVQHRNHMKYHHKYYSNMDDEQVDFLEDNFNFFNGSNHHTRLERRFMQSYRWYGDGIQSGIPEDELLKYVVAMESMLVPEEYGVKKKKLAERLADLMGVYDKCRDPFERKIISLYNTRNKIVHSAEIDIPEIDSQVTTAREISTQMYYDIIGNHIGECEGIEELLEDLEEREVPEAPETDS